MGANDIQQSLLDAMQLLSTKAANSTNAAITIKGEIVEEIDAGKHQYAVTYGGATYRDVYSMGNISYTVPSLVYILIPDGNFDNPKIILRDATNSVTNYTTEIETDMYVPVSSNLFGIENNIDLRSWVNESHTIDLDIDNFGIMFQDYLTMYRNFVFSADIKTEIDVYHQQVGNYGLILNLPFIQTGTEGTTTEIWKSYIMDVSTIPGTPYAFNEYSKINLYYEIDDTLEYDVNRNPFMTAFTQDFGYTEARTDIDYDIHIRNIAVKMVDVLSEADTTGYHLTVVPSEGNYFLNGKYVNKKTLSSVLKINAKTTDHSDWDCYWFVEDSSIDITSEGYLPIGGLGWKCLNKKTNVSYDAEGNKTFQYVTTNQTLEVTDEDVVSTLRYKCALTKDSIIVSGSTRLRNLNSSIEVELISATGSNTFIENIGNVRLIARIYYPGVTDVDYPTVGLSTIWQRFDQDGDYIDNDFYTIVRYNDRVDDYYETEISYPCSILEKLNTVNCTFYSTTTSNNTVTQNNLGTASIIVTTSKDFTYGVTIDGGDVLYKYDADGDSPMIANYDGPASSAIKTIDPITFRIFKPDGSELSDTEYLYAKYKWSFPKRSMMKLKGYTVAELEALEQDDDYYYIIGYGKSSINYTILDTYNKKKSDNSILLSIEIDGNTISDSANPKFIKDGESGTNGSKYAALLAYNGYAYGERDEDGVIQKLQAVYVGGSGWKIYDIPSKSLVDFNDPTLVPLVYKDGERITDGYTVAWDMFDFTQTNPCFNVVDGQIGIREDKTEWTDAEEIFCNVIECIITIDEDSTTNSPEVIYAYYPIEITRLINADMMDNIIPNLDGGYEEVVYASDGTNPQYDNTNAFECIDNVYNDDADDFYDYDWSSSVNLKIGAGTGTGSSASIKPVTKFDNGVTKNYVKVKLTLSATKRAEIQTKINNLSDEIDATEDKISFYQHNRSHILDFVEKFEYNYYEEKLKNAKQILEYRYQLMSYIPRLREVLQELYDYCSSNNIKISDFNWTRYYDLYNTTLDTVYRNLYLLGYSREISDISDLTSSTIVVNVDRLTSNYGAAIARQINSLASTWTGLTTNYQTIYVKLVSKVSGVYVLQEEYDSLASFNDELDEFIDDYDLTYLAEAHDNNEAAPEFVQLKSQLSALYYQITDYTNGEITSYSAFINDVLKPINSALSIYKNTEYQEKYYDKIDTELNAELLDLQSQKASYEAYLLPVQSDYIIHIKPIVMLFNRYELGNINGWDGSKLYIDEVNNEYLLAPQVGAGAKSNGRFTGVIMGVKQFNASDLQHIGLFGYSDGIQSFFANSEDGSFIMGRSGAGQIIIDPSPSKALLYSTTFWKEFDKDGKPSSYGTTNYNKQGMLIDLTTPEIRFGNGNFVVQSTGEMTAVGGGTIAGWKINDYEIYSNLTKANGRITLDSGARVTGTDEEGNKTYTYSNGKIYSHSHETLTSTNTGFYLAADGLSIGNSIRVSSADGGSILVGRLSSGRHWTINGNGSNSYIGYNASSFNSSSPSVYIGTDGISLGKDKFWVNDSGEMLSKSGTIGGWTITNSTIQSGGTTLDSDGTIYCRRLEASTSGTIGGWSISSGGLSASGITISSGGSIYASGWSINSGGDATFNNITCKGIWNFGSGSNTWTNSGFAWGNGTISLGSSGYGANGISWTGGSATVSGTLYAQSGHIGGDFIVDGKVVASGINASNITTGTLSANRITAATIGAKIEELSVLYAKAVYSRGALTGGDTSLGATRIHGSLSVDSDINMSGSKVATQSWVAENFVQK